MCIRDSGGRAGNIAQRSQFTGGEDRLEVGIAARLAEGADLVVQGLSLIHI